MSIDVVIVNYRSAEDVARCLEVLGAWGDGSVWVVDNSEQASEAEALASLASTRPWVRLVMAPRNLGFGGGCNLAFEGSQASRLLLLNPDALIAPSDIRTLDAALDADASLAAVSPSTYWNRERTFLLPAPTVEGPLNTLRPRLMALSAPGARWWATRRIERERRRAAVPAVRPVRSLAAAVLLLRRDAVEAAGGLFDPGFFMFFEDADLSIRVRRAGYRLALVQAAHAVHEYRHRTSKAAPMAHSAQLYFAKHYPRWLRWTRDLELVAPPPQTTAFERRCEPVGAFADAAAFNARVGAGVLAFSPTPWLWPALFRPLELAPRGFDDAEWALLEPGPYAALVVDGHAARWISFEKHPTAD